jgi:hypothetical protein
MKFSLTFDCDNAAFDDFPESEIARILRSVADRVDDGDRDPGGLIFDVNGNHVGEWNIEEEN